MEIKIAGHKKSVNQYTPITGLTNFDIDPIKEKLKYSKLNENAWCGPEKAISRHLNK